MTKIYRATTKLTLPVPLGGKVNYVAFLDEHNGASVTDEKLQKAIEATSYFKRGEIKLFESIGNKPQLQAATEAKPKGKEFPEVTGIQEAVEILKGEPYLVAPGLLKSPDSVRQQAEANGVKFPNLKV